jgi:hypothetical protein
VERTAKAVRTEKAARSPLLLTDWTANVEAIATDRDSFLWELILHALLWNQILIQDEALVQSQVLADWFHEPQQFRLLDELIDTGVFVVLKQAPSSYPTSSLQELALHSPIQARAKHIAENIGKHGKRFCPTEQQLKFHKKLDGALKKKKATRERRGSGGSKNIHDLFSDHMLRVLHDPLAAKSFGLASGLLKTSAIYVQNPQKAAREARKSRPFALDPRFAEAPRFTRHLGHQVAYHLERKFGRPQGRAFDSLVHSAFAKAICEVEGGATGRYGKTLRELPLPSDELRKQPRGKDVPAEVVAEFRQPLKLPPLRPGLAEIIRSVRETEACKALRYSIGEPNERVPFEKEKEYWRTMSEKLSSLVFRNARKISVNNLVLTTKRTLHTVAHVHLFGGFLELLRHPPRNRHEARAALTALGLGSVDAMKETAFLSLGLSLEFFGLSDREAQTKARLIDIFPIRTSK